MIELMSIPEITQVMDLWKKSVSDLVNSGAIKNVSELKQEVKEIYETSNVYVVKNERSEIIGYASIVEGAYLENIYILEDQRRKGNGSALIKHIQSKYDEVITDVIVNNESGNQFILSLGFVSEEVIYNEVLSLDEVSYYWSN